MSRISWQLVERGDCEQTGKRGDCEQTVNDVIASRHRDFFLVEISQTIYPVFNIPPFFA